MGFAGQAALAVELTAADNGVGLPEAGGPRSGPRNLAERAGGLGGELTLTAPPGGGGVRLVWRGPLVLGGGEVT